MTLKANENRPIAENGGECDVIQRKGRSFQNFGARGRIFMYKRGQSRKGRKAQQP